MRSSKMAEKTMYISQQQTKPIKILKWKVREGNTISVGRIVLLYDFEGAAKVEQRKLKVSQAGTVHKILVQEGAVVKPGETLLELKECSHPTIMNDMCAECGTDLRKNDSATIASVPMIHAIPDLKVSEELAQKLGKADSDRLIKDRKLALLVDLDQTLIHTTNDNIQPNIKDVYHFQLYSTTSPWYHTRLRPGTHDFLNNIFPYFELHICTFGARNYAHTIAMFLDNEQKLFSNRILSRDECFDPSSKKANLKALFPCGDNMVCIIDDREDVWSNATNLIHVKPYHFFQHTGDIHAPPGLDKHENDNKGVDLTKIKSRPPVDQDQDDEEDVETAEMGTQTEPAVPLAGFSSAATSRECNGEKHDKENELLDDKGKNDMEEKKDGDDEEMPEESTKGEKKEGAEAVYENKQEQNDNGKKEKVKRVEVGCKKKADKKVGKVITENVSTSTEKEAIVKNNSNIVDIKVKNGEDIEGKNGDIENSKDKSEVTKSDRDGGAEKEVDDIQENNKTADKKGESAEKNTSGDLEEKRKDVEKEGDDGEKIADDTISKGEDTKNNGEDTNEKVENAESKNKEAKQPSDSNDLIEIEDPDDYLMYLEDILKRIHGAFYDEYDKLESGEVPDLKQVIPAVRGRVLKGCHLVFSGLVPTHSRLETSRAYQIARSLGAEVTPELGEESTHLVAVRPGTAKVNSGRRKKNLKIVTPDWLWCCAERWEHVSEKMFPLNSKGSKNRHPPPHCSSPEHSVSYPEHNTPATRKRTPSGRFMDTINPLMSFSSADIDAMGKEVEDILDDESDSSTDADQSKKPTRSARHQVQRQTDKKPVTDSSSSSSSVESLTAEYPKGYKRKRDDGEVTNEEMNNTTEDDEMPSIKFRRGERVDDEFDLEERDSQESDEADSIEAPDDEADDCEWNMMGAALEREFLSNN